MLTATGTAIGSCGGEGAAIAGSAIGAGISSYARDYINIFRFSKNKISF